MWRIVVFSLSIIVNYIYLLCVQSCDIILRAKIPLFSPIIILLSNAFNSNQTSVRHGTADENHSPVRVIQGYDENYRDINTVLSL